MRTSLLAVLATSFLSSAVLMPALAQPANDATAAPMPLTRDAAPERDQQSYRNNDQDRADDGRDYARDTQTDQRRDMFCRSDAARRTGYTSPGEAARDEQARGSIGGTLGGAALGAIIGGANGNAGTGAAIGAGAGLLAGSAIGAGNARRAARDVEADYADAYYDCMHEADANDAPGRYAAGPDGRYATDYPPPPVSYYGYGAPYPYYYPAYQPYYRPYPYYSGPSIGFSFGFGGGFHGGPRGGFRGGRRR